jgi:hypothetical protein
MKHSLTKEKVTKLYNHLKNEFVNKEFNYREIEEYLFNTEVHGMHFYYFVYAGVIDTLKRGVYKINNLFFKMTPELIYEKGRQYLADNRVKKIKNKKQLPLFEETKSNKLNEKDAILLLKKLGYKIMKPVQQYEEV